MTPDVQVTVLTPWHYTVTSSRPGEAPYQVLYRNGQGQCTCPGFQRWARCKHVAAVRAVAGDAPAPVREEPMHPDQPQRALARVPVQAVNVEEPSRALTNLSVQDVAQMADRLASAQGFLPKGITEPAQVFAVVLTGQEVGIGPMAALRHIPMVEGKPDPSAELLLALIRSRYGPATIRVAETTADHCTIEWRQPGWDGVQSFTWTAQDSARAGLNKKFNHQAYPAAMNRARAIKFVARSHFPEVALGLDLGGDEEREPAPRGQLVAPSPRLLEVACSICGEGGYVFEADSRRASADGYTCADRTACRERAGRPSTTARLEPGVLQPRDGLLTADELQPGGIHTGEQGGILGERGWAYDPDLEPAVGEVVGRAECASCGTVAECTYDGEAYICADNAACVARQRSEPRPDGQATLPLEAPARREEPTADPNRASAKQVDSIRAHLLRTAKTEGALVEELGHPLDRLPRTDASVLLRDLAKLPNAPAAVGDEGEAF